MSGRGAWSPGWAITKQGRRSAEASECKGRSGVDVVRGEWGYTSQVVDTGVGACPARGDVDQVGRHMEPEPWVPARSGRPRWRRDASPGRRSGASRCRDWSGSSGRSYPAGPCRPGRSGGARRSSRRSSGDWPIPTSSELKGVPRRAASSRTRSRAAGSLSGEPKCVSPGVLRPRRNRAELVKLFARCICRDRERRSCHPPTARGSRRRRTHYVVCRSSVCPPALSGTDVPVGSTATRRASR